MTSEPGMSRFNVSAALEGEPTRGHRCKLQKILDEIPPDAPDLDALLDGLMGEHPWPAQDAAVRMSAGGAPVSDKVIQAHRTGRCFCNR